jgi:hypothetical protein
MKLAVAAIACGLVSLMAACSGGSAPPVGTTNSSSEGPFAATNSSPGVFNSTANTAPGPFAPVADPGPFGVQPTGGPAPGAGGTPAELCAQACAHMEQLGCRVPDCAAECAAPLAQLPEACHAAYAAYLGCLLANGTCAPDGGVEASGCAEFMAAINACVRPNGVQAGGP